MTFGEALAAMRDHNAKVQRARWETNTSIRIVGQESFVDLNEDAVATSLGRFIAMRRGHVREPWTPTHADLLAYDWRIAP